MAVVEPADVERFMEICAKWDVLATVVGEVTDGERLIIDWHGETVVDVDPRTVAHEGPTYNRPFARPAWQDDVHAAAAEFLPRDGDLPAQFLAIVTSPACADKTWVTEQYDRYVRGDTVLAQPDDAGVLRIDEETGLGIALATDGNGRMTLLEPYLGAQLALAEAYRNVAITGAEPVAITDCLNYGNPENTDVMWQFVESIMGLVAGCQELGIPVTGGNVSFYNQTGDTQILPTPVVGVLGVIDDVAQRVGSGFAYEGDAILLLGDTEDHLSGSVWAEVVHDHHLGGHPPVADFEREKAIAAIMRVAAAEQLVSSAHDLSDGGLAVALTESCLRHGLGASLTLPEGDRTTLLFSESPGRVLVSLPAASLERFTALCAEHGVPLARLGEVTGDEIEIRDVLSVPLAEIRRRWSETIPAGLGARAAG